MITKVRRGKDVPTIDQLANYQLGFSDTTKHLYIRDNEEIIDLNGHYNQGDPPQEFYNSYLKLYEVNFLKSDLINSEIMDKSNNRIDKTAHLANKNTYIPILLARSINNVPNMGYKLTSILNIDDNIKFALTVYRRDSNGYQYLFFFKKLIDEQVGIFNIALFDGYPPGGLQDEDNDGKTVKKNEWYTLDNDTLYYWDRYRTSYEFFLTESRINYLIEIRQPTEYLNSGYLNSISADQLKINNKFQITIRKIFLDENPIFITESDLLKGEEGIKV
jgi:hypothetical protein